MWKIIQGLYLGTKADSENVASLEAAGVTHVVNCAAELPCPFEDTFQYLHLRLKDPDDRLGRRLTKALAFIDRGREGGAVLVHCAGAVSRSPAVILAYLCHAGSDLDEAADTIREAVRTRPNAVFLRQLRDYFGLKISDDEIMTLAEKLSQSRTRSPDVASGPNSPPAR
jgi:predicted protein tyrosine phosphatase